MLSPVRVEDAKMALTPTYSSGLRSSECISLCVRDIILIVKEKTCVSLIEKEGESKRSNSRKSPSSFRNLLEPFLSSRFTLSVY
jgi:hypothetical protein